MAFRLFRQMLPAVSKHDGRRVLIYGAGDGGELLLRELRNNRELQLAPIGFWTTIRRRVESDSRSARVWGQWRSRAVCSQHEIDEVVISSMKMTEERVEEVLRTCSERQIKVKRMRITMEDLSLWTMFITPGKYLSCKDSL